MANCGLAAAMNLWMVHPANHIWYFRKTNKQTNKAASSLYGWHTDYSQPFNELT